MKRIFTLAIVFAILASLMIALPVSAADKTVFEAKPNTPAIDGTVSDGEYGEAFVLSKDTGVTWNDLEITGSYSYQFAWDSKGLYVAMSYDSALNNPQLQLAVFPVAQASMPANNQPLFFTIAAADGAVSITQHHHKTNLADANQGIADKTEAAVKTTGNTVVVEVLIPVAALQIVGTSDDFAVRGGSSIGLSLSVMESSNAGTLTCTTIEVGAGADGWNAPNIGLDTLNFVSNNETGDISMAAIIAVSMISLAVILKKKVIA